jgi:hypothetical protein
LLHRTRQHFLDLHARYGQFWQLLRMDGNSQSGSGTQGRREQGMARNVGGAVPLKIAPALSKIAGLAVLEGVSWWFSMRTSCCPWNRMDAPGSPFRPGPAGLEASAARSGKPLASKSPRLKQSRKETCNVQVHLVPDPKEDRAREPDAWSFSWIEWLSGIQRNAGCLVQRL